MDYYVMFGTAFGLAIGWMHWKKDVFRTVLFKVIDKLEGR